LFFNANSAIFQLYNGENNEMMMRYPLCSSPTRWVGFL